MEKAEKALLYFTAVALSLYPKNTYPYINQWWIQALRWGGGGHSDPEIRGKVEGLVSKKIFSALQASVWSKIKGGGGQASPESATVSLYIGPKGCK